MTSPSFDQSLLTFVRSDGFPVSGARAAALANQVKTIREALDLMEARSREALAYDPDGLPGWALAPGALVRETYSVSALKVWKRLKEEATKHSLELKDFLSCCRINLGELTQRLAELEGVEPKIAADRLEQIFEGLFSVRQNRSSLRRLGADEALLQAVRLSEKEGSAQ